MSQELTLCQQCNRARFQLPSPHPGGPKAYDWRPVPACFSPKPGLTVNVEECPDCERKRIRNN